MRRVLTQKPHDVFAPGAVLTQTRNGDAREPSKPAPNSSQDSAPAACSAFAGQPSATQLSLSHGETLADRASLTVLPDCGQYAEYSFLDRGSDERQWCSPGADLPVCSVMRSKYGEYPEYHTSLDDLENVVTPAGLQGGLDVMKACITLLEANAKYQTVLPGEPQMGRRGLYPTTSIKGGADDVRNMMNVIAYCDGAHDIIELCERTGLPWSEVVTILRRLEAAEVVTSEP